ncbi:hypothetical protein POTOM_021546 [Populus tomentosa]|uniref:1-phosphatidylinositol-4-phosphate 5-kinase n=1 Tax=Populus tomentosa TaxID=118781 RepID=A0A8X7ZS45_POPTO|nr:hypothetical protein POTOM_021546 [Populus tomentosa]
MREGLIVDEVTGVVSNTQKKKSGELDSTTTTNNKQLDKVILLVADQDITKQAAIPPLPIVVGRARSQSSTRRVTPATTVVTASSSSGTTVEKHLPNGDLYIGSFSGHAPHGSGKYIWTDGCMYEGEWRRGKASGKGKFSWPSGATFEGGFKSGRMEGSGTFIGSDGDTYRGSWSSDRKHGHGQKRYANGDFYEGTWKKNFQDGQGRYVWKNGNEYVGEWKNGVISGRGVLIWANGNRYDGQWENGVPKGNGVFTWPDGSCYIGNLNNNSKDIKGQQLNGTFYPGNGNECCLKGNKSDLVLTATTTRKRSSVDGGRGSGMNFPRICIWESDGEAGDITCDIVDNVEAEMIYRDGLGLDRDGIRQFRRAPCCFSGGEVKKPGLPISKGHKNYDLMLNLQLGIRYSVGKHAQILRDLKPSDFDPKEKFWTRFPPEGSKITPPHQSSDFRWKDYCPVVFRYCVLYFEIARACDFYFSLYFGTFKFVMVENSFKVFSSIRVLHAGKKDSYRNEKFMRGCRFLEAELQDMDRVLSGRYISFLSVFIHINNSCLRGHIHDGDPMIYKIRAMLSLNRVAELDKSSFFGKAFNLD